MCDSSGYWGVLGSEYWGSSGFCPHWHMISIQQDCALVGRRSGGLGALVSGAFAIDLCTKFVVKNLNECL